MEAILGQFHTSGKLWTEEVCALVKRCLDNINIQITVYSILDVRGS